MFYSERIKQLEQELQIKDAEITAISNIIDKIEDERKEMKKQIEAIIECLNGDRKDINILIQLVKKSQSTTKRKK